MKDKRKSRRDGKARKKT